MIDQRIAERRAIVRDSRRRSRRRRTVLVAVLVVVIGTLVAIERSPLVGLEEVRVTGTSRLSTQTVLDAAALDLGTSTLRLGLGDATRRVVALPVVVEASARRIDPLTVEITVVEREPILNVTGAGATRLVDDDGVLFAEDRIGALPEIALDDEPPNVGDDVTRDPALANAHEVWQALSGPLRVEVQRLAAVSDDELVLHLERGIRVRFGRAQRLDEKVRALGAILADLDSGAGDDIEVDVIDVRAPAAPVIVAR